MIRRLPLLLWLVIVWVALWEKLSAANLLSGALVGTALLLAFPLDPPTIKAALRPVAAARFLGYFAAKLVEASAVVAWEVVTPRNRINEGIVAVPILGASDLVITVVANAISLTPGTLTIDVRRAPATLYVHVLHLHDIESVRRDVRRLEALAIRAFGGAAAVAALDDDRDQKGLHP